VSKGGLATVHMVCVKVVLKVQKHPSLQFAGTNSYVRSDKKNFVCHVLQLNLTKCCNEVALAIINSGFRGPVKS